MPSDENIVKAWKYVGYISFAGMTFGTLIITAILPLMFVVMGELEFELIATHSRSFRMIAHWTLGIGLITMACYFFSGLAILVRKKSLTITAFILTILHFLSTLTVMILGTMPTDSKKKFFKDTWRSLNSTTAHVIQKHFSCCGFESASEWNIKDDSCYAVKSEKIVWPQGCYDRVMSASVPASTVTNTGGESVSGSSSWNNFIAAYAIIFIILLIIDCLSIAGYILILKITNFHLIKNCSNIRPHLMLRIKSEINAISLVDFDENVLENQYVSMKENEVSDDSKANGAKLNNNKVGSMDSEYIINGNNKTQNGSVDKSVKFTAGSPDNTETKTPWYSIIPHNITHGMESFFFWLGLLIGRHPKRTMLMTVIIVLSLCIGALQLFVSDESSIGFLPADLQLTKDFNTFNMLYPTKELQHKIIVEADDVISKNTLMETWELDKSVKNIKSSTSMTFDTLCLRYNARCGQESLFELWSYNDTNISAATDQSILDKIKPKNNLQSPYYGWKYDINNVLGGQVLESNEISNAKAHMLIYKTNFTFYEGDWQDKFIEFYKTKKAGKKVHVNAAKSFQTEYVSAYYQDIYLVFAGFVLVFFYIASMTGKFSLVRHRIPTALLGVLTAALAIGSGIGLASSFQEFDWTILHICVPFLILGIGVDDMFILLQTWTMIDEDPRFKKESVEEKAGHVLKTAGVSITVTSLTDLVAIGVGASSELRIFQSFCTYTAVCIALLFILSCTFFLACTVLDQRRREQNRDAICCWHKYGEDYQEGNCAKREIFQWIFENILGYYLEYPIIRIIIILITLALSGVMAWGFYELQVDFDPYWYLPSKSYVLDYNEAEKKYFDLGMDPSIYIIGADFYSEQSKLSQLYNNLYGYSKINNQYLKSWYHEYEVWPDKLSNPTETEFYMDVKTFLNSTTGNEYFHDVNFDPTGTKIGSSRIRLRHISTNNVVQDIEIMDYIRSAVTNANFSSTAFPFTWHYFNLEITKIIKEEVYRNILITLACVFVVVLPTLASLQMSLWVGMCVVFTIVDVAGTMHFSGLNIEASTIISLLLTVGLAVDYAAHIGHKFLTLKGSRTLRMRVSLSHVGPAVFNGGFSTFLALVVLGASSIYIYKVFFTVFTSVVGFGLWNGLFFLPSVLGFIGPPAHRTAHDAQLSDRARIRLTTVTKK